MTKIIAPSILSADFARLGEEVKAVAAAGADWIHVDVMDGHFVPNITVGPLIVGALRPVTTLPLDVHLMIADPAKYAEEFIKAGANSVTIHHETVRNPRDVLARIRKHGAKCGISVKPATPISTIEPILTEVDLVLVMTVEPGFGGQKLLDECVKKIAELSHIRKERGLKFLIEADGGISEKTAHTVSKAGCDVFVAGSAIFKADDYTSAISKIREKL